MTYVATPGRRLAYDLDGSLMATRTLSDVVTVLASSSVSSLNDERNGTAIITNSNVNDNLYVVILFPAPRDLFGLWASVGQQQPLAVGGTPRYVTIETSPDAHTVNGDGTWNSAGIDVGEDFLWDTWRVDIESFSASNVWALQGLLKDAGLTDDTKMYQLHIYGAPNDASVPDRVILIDDDTGLEFDNVLDWGDLPRGAVKSHMLQVKNNSATHTANGVTLGLNTFHDDIHEIRDGAGAYSTALSLGNIAAGVTYANDITIKVDVASTAALGPFTNRLTVDVTSWST